MYALCVCVHIHMRRNMRTHTHTRAHVCAGSLACPGTSVRTRPLATYVNLGDPSSHMGQGLPPLRLFQILVRFGGLTPTIIYVSADTGTSRSGCCTLFALHPATYTRKQVHPLAPATPKSCKCPRQLNMVLLADKTSTGIRTSMASGMKTASLNGRITIKVCLA